MDAVTYIKEYKRMCESFNSNDLQAKPCDGCPLDGLADGCHMLDIADNAEECVDAVERWAKEHPAKTRQSEFLKMFPEAIIEPAAGYIDICPALLLVAKRATRTGGCGDSSIDCEECKGKFWLEEIKDGET